MKKNCALLLVVLLNSVSSCSEEQGTAENDTTLYTNVYQVPPAFLNAPEVGLIDKFLEKNSEARTTLRKRPTLREILESAGVDFPEGAEAYSTTGSKFYIRNTTANMQKVEAWLEQIRANPGNE